MTAWATTGISVPALIDLLGFGPAAGSVARSGAGRSCEAVPVRRTKPCRVPRAPSQASERKSFSSRARIWSRSAGSLPPSAMQC